ncbi:13523_t:CDS:1, partial [Gigaspora margarita]
HLTACGLYEPVAQYLNVSESEVPELLSNQKILTEGNRILTPLLNPSIFGGSYIDIKANKININILDMSQQGIITNNTAMKPYLNLLLFVQ